MEDSTTQTPRSSNSMIIVFVLVALVVVGGYLLMRGRSTTNSTTAVPTSTTNTGVQPVETTETFMVEGSEFAFSPASMVVTAGTPVSVTFTNTGKMPHDFVIDEISGARTQILQPGQSETIQFTPPAAGTFTYYCSVGNHRSQGMEGTLTVQ
jgi:plastocyanin